MANDADRTTHLASARASGAPDRAARALASELGEQLGGRSPGLVLAFASPDQPLSGVSAELRGRFPEATVLGASTAGEFTERGDSKGGVVACAVSGGFRVAAAMGDGLAADPERAVSQALERVPPRTAGLHRTAILLLDPLTGRGEEAALIAGTQLGADVPLAGGAAGDDLRMRSTEVACGAQVASDALVLAVIDSTRPLGLGVAHGHVPLSSELRVTRASGATVYEIDGRPAWQAWTEHTRASAAERGVDPDGLRDEDVGGYLLRYEAGLPTGSSYKIRAPLMRNADGSLGFACAIPEGASLRITESVPERQIDSAREAARRARRELGGAPVAGALVFDCICRNLILGDRFRAAVDAIGAELGNAPLAGFETYGEIALSAGDMSGFHNTTTVVLAFPQ
jgi:hypothetical protein